MKVELLAPAGSYEALEAAFEAGRMLSIWAVRNLEPVPMPTIWIRNS